MKDIKKLSTDQYLYRICLAIKDVSCSSSVTDNSPGKLSHARWLTPENRLLRLYIGTASPSQNLIILVKCVMLVYDPMWFEIKNEIKLPVWCPTFLENDFPCKAASRQC
ncbi:hypothetical protein AVEN_202465-1 [Araneus ventricosus]|uniref:Uncharacterized protein n=1 Tax=Araneus ventricosus TaxID=182803 RepID=A0A4Y2SJT7_ARAVE|nr:hypothetical protein AVEN_202465-1 [Araneus ventricosus]